MVACYSSSELRTTVTGTFSSPRHHREVVGEPLQSTLADLLGYSVAHDEWPSWIDDLAAEIERSLW
jgi:hypothetical protein